MKLINADELIELMQNHRRCIFGDGLIEDHRRDEVDCCIEYVKRVPTVDAVERKRGRWIPIVKGERGYSAGDFRCSVCGDPCKCYHLTNFCPNCGAEMRGESE